VVASFAKSGLLTEEPPTVNGFCSPARTASAIAWLPEVVETDAEAGVAVTVVSGVETDAMVSDAVVETDAASEAGVASEPAAVTADAARRDSRRRTAGETEVAR
jgi:hypothetical protein